MTSILRLLKAIQMLPALSFLFIFALRPQQQCSGLIPGCTTLRITPGRGWGTISAAGDWTWLRHMQSKHSACCIVTPRPLNFTFLETVPLSDKTPNGTVISFYSHTLTSLFWPHWVTYPAWFFCRLLRTGYISGEPQTFHPEVPPLARPTCLLWSVHFYFLYAFSPWWPAFLHTVLKVPSLIFPFPCSHLSSLTGSFFSTILRILTNF